MPGFWQRLDPQRRLAVVYSAAGLLLFGGYFVLPQPGSAASYLGLAALPLLAIAAGTRRYGPRDLRPWLMLFAGQAAFFVGDVTWYSAYLPIEVSPAVPHISDLFYLAGYPLLAAGVWLFIRARQPRYRVTAGLDALVIGVAAVLVLWGAVIDGFIHDETISMAERSVSLGYPIADVLLLAAAAYLMLSDRHGKRAFYLLVASMAALSLGDLSYVVVPDEQLAAYVSDGLWMASYILFGLTALVPSMASLTEPSNLPTAPEGTRRLVLLGAAIAVLPIFAIYQRLFEDHQDLALTVISAVVVFVAILLRMRELSEVHRRAESRYSSLLANASDAFAIVSPEGHLTYASPASNRVLGYPPDRLPGRSVLEFVHPRAVDQTVAALRAVAAEHWSQRETELRIQRGDGRWRWLNVLATNRLDDPIVNGIVLNLRDVTERKESESRLDLQARVLDEVQHAVLVTDVGGRISYWNRAAEQLFGWPAEAALGLELADVGLAAATDQARELLAGASAAETRLSGEIDVRRPDGRALTAIVTSSPLLGERGRPRGMIVVAFDITDRKQLEERLQQQAFTDALTGLANRALFLDRVGHVLSRRRGGAARARLAVLFLDVDDFKTVNDSMGHVAGDELLTVLGRRLTSVLRPSDTAARLGGDEFAILLEDASQPEAEAVAQRVLAELARPVRVGERDVHISVSIGIAVPSSANAVSAAELLRDADLAMYRAKTQLQGSYAVYQPGMHEAALRRLELRADLQLAIENDGLEIEYQPIFRLDDTQPVGAEALLRWRHPQRGTVPPLEIISLAEAAGLMMPLSRWILARATAAARRWNTAVPETAPFVSVNASAHELLDPSYAGVVAEALRAADLPADALAVEITESDLMQDTEATIDGLRGLKRLGVRLAIDDFGTGYSSLAYLARFPLDVLKIDRAFVSTRQTDHDGAIARAIIDLAGSLGLTVVAEGIEHESDRKLMVSLGATWGQGFHLGRPTSAKQIGALFSGKVPPRRARARRARATTDARLANRPAGA